jgi:exo-1,4-beta-D-glucosaminidase
METKTEHQGNHWYLVTRLKNNSGHPAFMIRLKVVGNKTEGLILPVIYSDNYVSLMPGEQRTINIEMEDVDTRGEAPKVLMEGVNIK